MNIENMLTYDPVQWQLVAHILILGFASMAAGFVYFMTTMREVAPRYRIASVLGGIVMVSAFLLLFAQWQSWQTTFTFQNGEFVRSEGVFSNGFRYLNWLIDVPMLLLQLVVILGLGAATSRRLGIIFVGSGVAMILLGYVGQFYEVTNLTALWAWGGISTVFYIILLYYVWVEIGRALPRMPASAAATMKSIRWLFLIAWTIYPLAYIMPAILPTADGVVLRQAIYTVADITSKVIYGVLVTKVAMDLSKAEGWITTSAEKEVEMVSIN
ncbi:bacteriorhodopsin [Bellilinea caldifistulae]|uniref:Rhodopsin n=1 Tax=Bellilinea caldifistulae TaxID=360411 RepID=A0A0P6XBM7_9CHLR|nr:bacteriorhodopsin [Bellilinea caldifistulae]KPL72137.1 hypothetical protein AC812_16280 [Bellilinea caldifistulae]GAP09179.1 bacteriorhodopsin [Bellilinea caldifistulae]